MIMKKMMIMIELWLVGYVCNYIVDLFAYFCICLFLVLVVVTSSITAILVCSVATVRNAVANKRPLHAFVGLAFEFVSIRRTIHFCFCFRPTSICIYRILVYIRLIFSFFLLFFLSKMKISFSKYQFERFVVSLMSISEVVLISCFSCCMKKYEMEYIRFRMLENLYKI